MAELRKDRIQRVAVIGVPISAVNMDSTLSLIHEGLVDGSARGSYVCVSNVHTTVMAHDDPEYLLVQKSSFLTLPDGKPLSIAGSRLVPQMARVTGPDLMRRIFEDPRFAGCSHYFYGNTESNLAKLIERLGQLYPAIKIAGFEPSVFREMPEEEENELCDRFNRSGADFVWVGLGAPRQECFCFRCSKKTRSVFVGVGGAFNILAGITPEAPKWMKNASLEWLYRLIQEPRRLFKRYTVTNSRFVYLLKKEGCKIVEQ